MESELSASVRLYPEVYVGAGRMAGSSAKRYYCCWHLDLARSSFLHLLLPSSFFSLHAPNPPTSSAVHYTSFILFCFSVYLIFFIFFMRYCYSSCSHEKHQHFPLAYWKCPIYCDTVISQVAFPACFHTEGEKMWSY